MTTFTQDLLSAFSWHLRDPRVEQWPLLSSLWPNVAICSVYVILVLFVGPYFMRKREPLNVQVPIIVYNLVQVVCSLYLFVSLGRLGWFGRYSYWCENVDRNPDPASPAGQMTHIMYWAFLIRYLDFFDTFFFLARKKFSNISVLHVIHHFVTPLYAWLVVRYYPGGHDSFGPFLNSFVHSVMYTYYLLAILGPAFRPYLWWKRYLTRLQLVQFVAVMGKDLVVVAGYADCGFPWQMSFVTILLMLLMLALFSEFYIKEYVNKKPKKQE